MSKREKTTLVPKLRFPYFSDEWKKESLSVYLKESRIKGSTGEFAKKLTVKLWGKGVFEKQESLSGSENTQYYHRKKEQFIYSKLDFLNQAFGIIPEYLDGYESTLDLPCFDVNKNLNTNFLLEYVQRPTFYKKYGEIADGGRKAKRIQVETFLGFPIYLPTLPEQQKIVDCLSSLDNFIAAEDRKLLVLRNYKKGLMQKLFPTGDETMPEWRFPEFRECEQWKKTFIDKVVDYENGKAHENNISEYGKYIVVNSKFISTEGKIVKYTNTANMIANTGDILMVLSDVPNGRAIAKCYLVNQDDKYAVNQRVCKLTPTKANGNFLFHIINRNAYFLAFDDGIKQTNLKKDDVLQCPILLPKGQRGLEEQKKIAECLSSVDELISMQTEKIEALKTHKKGLMQGLFPSIEKVSE